MLSCQDLITWRRPMTRYQGPDSDLQNRAQEPGPGMALHAFCNHHSFTPPPLPTASNFVAACLALHEQASSASCVASCSSAAHGGCGQHGGGRGQPEEQLLAIEHEQECDEVDEKTSCTRSVLQRCIFYVKNLDQTHMNTEYKRMPIAFITHEAETRTDELVLMNLLFDAM